MGKEKIWTYITPKALEEIIIFGDEYTNLNSILSKYAVLLVDMTDEEWDKISEDDSNEILQFIMANDIQLVPLHSFFKSLKEEPDLMLEKPRSLYLLNVSEEKAKELSDSYGLIVESDEAINDKILQLNSKYNFSKGDSILGESDGWSNILKGKNLRLGNSIILSDNYLMTNETNGKNVGFENLKFLFKSLLPKKLDTAFHILIVCNHPPVGPEPANRLVGNLKSYLKTIRDYDINLEVVFNDTIHPRKIISNYYVIKADKGFKLLKTSNDKKVYDDNEIAITSIFNSPNESEGDSEFDISFNNLKKIKNQCIALKEQIISGIKDDTKRILGDCDKDKSLVNRLICSI